MLAEHTSTPSASMHDRAGLARFSDQPARSACPPIVRGDGTATEHLHAVHDDAVGKGPPQTDSYARNTAARDDYRQMQKLIIPEPNVGIQLVQGLRSANRAVDVTGRRRERKSVLPKRVWDDITGKLAREGIKLESRESTGNSGRVNTTLTYYGTSAVFYNHQQSTKLRMRIRFYLSYARDVEGNVFDVQRAKNTSSKGFLEVKVKTPRAAEENSVDKYRLLVPDRLLAELVNLDATSPEFDAKFDRLHTAVTREVLADSEGTEDARGKIDAMFAVLHKLAKRKASFIRPSVVISYERAGYKYLENDYPIPQRNPSRPQRLALPWRNRAQLKTPSSSDIEYQFTVDQRVRGHYPLLPKPGEERMPVVEHFDPANRTEFSWYPADARVVEFKEPAQVATLARKDRSKTHNFLVDTLCGPMQDQIMWGDYDENVGKYGNFRRRIMESHNKHRIENEMIGIDLSDTHVPEP